MKVGGLIPWSVTVILSDWKTPDERRFGEPTYEPMCPSGPMVEHHPISAKDQARHHKFLEKVILAFTIGRRIWREDILVSDVEELKNVDASESHARRLNAMEVLVPKSGQEFYFSFFVDA